MVEIREHSYELPVNIEQRFVTDLLGSARGDNPRFLIVGTTGCCQGGGRFTVDLQDVLDWVMENKPELLAHEQKARI